MSPIAFGLILGGSSAATGILLLLTARRLARMQTWWQSQLAKVPMLKPLAQFGYSEGLSLTIIRCLAVTFIIGGALAPILAIVIQAAGVFGQDS